MKLVNENGQIVDYTLSGTPITPRPLKPTASRVIYSAAHVVANPRANADPSDGGAIDWNATMNFRRHLAGLGLGIAEAMDTAQRGMGLDWPTALELIRRTREELPDARVANGVGTDQLAPKDAREIDDVRRAYFEQIQAVQSLDARMVIMASRALAKLAQSEKDYIELYGEILRAANYPVILHWLGPAFDAELRGYWGSEDFERNLDTVLTIINDNLSKVDGIKISLLDANKEIALRNRLPKGVKMYTGDDFNYPELIAGDQNGHSHALLGIFDPLAPLVASSISALDEGNVTQFHNILDPTVPFAREIFRAPTQFYKTGVVFLAWLNGFQNHFVMLGGAQAMRPITHFTKIFMMADELGLLADPEAAAMKMQTFLALYGIEQ